VLVLGQCTGPGGRGVGELSDGFHDPVPRSRSVIVASEREFSSSSSTLLECLLAVAPEHQLRRTPNVDLGYHSDTMYGPVDKPLRPVSLRLSLMEGVAAGKVSRLEATMFWRARTT
jgi:hypothetical protein